MDFIELFKSIPADKVVGLLALALVVGYLISYTIEGLKKAGRIKSGTGQAGRWNEALSAVIGFIVFALRYLKQDAEITEASQFAMLLATAIVFVIVTASSSKYVHLLSQWWRGTPPKALPVTVTMSGSTPRTDMLK